MTITARTADITRRLADIAACDELPAWSRRRDVLIRATLAEAVALKTQMDALEAFVEKGFVWWAQNQHRQGEPAFDAKAEKLWDAIAARNDARDALGASLRLLGTVDVSDIPRALTDAWDAIPAMEEVA